MGDDAPKGLPLICRFSYLTPASSGRRGGSWLHREMENPYPRNPVHVAPRAMLRAMRCLSQNKLPIHLLRKDNLRADYT